jgi:hypothetical protein
MPKDEKSNSPTRDEELEMPVTVAVAGMVR